MIRLLSLSVGSRVEKSVRAAAAVLATSLGVLAAPCVLAASGCLLVSTATGVAEARGVVSDAGPLFSPIRRGSLDRFATLLEMDREQRATMVELFNGYRESLRRAAQESDARVEEKRKTAGDKPEEYKSVMQAEAAEMKIFFNASAKAERTFFDDLAAILAPEQAAKVGVVERFHLRQSAIRFCLAAGENVDLIETAYQLKIPQDGAVGETLREYEVAVDAQFKTKRASFFDLFERVSKAELEGEGSSSPMAFIDDIKKLVDQSVAVRDSNRKFVRAVSSSLNDADRERWEAAFREQSYPRVFRTSAVTENITAALKIEGLSEDQRNRLSLLQEAYVREALPVNSKWAAEIDNKVEEFREKGLAVIMTFMMSDDADREKDALVIARKARFALDEAHHKRIIDILNPEQIKTLPHQTARHPKMNDDVVSDLVAFDEELFESAEKEFIGDEEDAPPQTAK